MRRSWNMRLSRDSYVAHGLVPFCGLWAAFLCTINKPVNSCKTTVEMQVQKKGPDFWSKGEIHLLLNITKDLNVSRFVDMRVIMFIGICTAAWKWNYLWSIAFH